MSRPALGIIGADWHGEALSRLGAPLCNLALTHWSAGPDGSDAAMGARCAAAIGTGFTHDWQALAADPSLSVIAIIGDTSQRAGPAITCLQAGKTVLCLGPTFADRATLLQAVEAQVAGKGGLLVAGEIAYTPAGAHALGLVRSGSLGTIHSTYMALRAPRASATSGTTSLDRLRWEAFDFLLAMEPGPIATVYASGGRLFGTAAADDTAVIILRLGSESIVTIELSCCLPPTIASAGLGEVEIEIVGTEQVVRVDPHNADLRVHADHLTGLLPWVDDPLVTLLEQSSTGVPAMRDVLARQQMLVDLTQATRQSLATGQPVVMAR